MTAFALLGLGASAVSTWVHYRILNDPTYVESVCDVNATVSCTAAYSSRFGSFAGVPVAVFGTLFFVFVLFLIAWSAKSAVTRDNLSGYVFAASTIGLAAVLYLGYASFFILGAVCLAVPHDLRCGDRPVSHFRSFGQASHDQTSRTIRQRSGPRSPRA